MHLVPNRLDPRLPLNTEGCSAPGEILVTEHLLGDVAPSQTWRPQHLSHVDAHVWELLMHCAIFAPIFLETVALKGVVAILHRLAPYLHWRMPGTPTHPANFVLPRDFLALWE
jgi:hypothetical protein